MKCKSIGEFGNSECQRSNQNKAAIFVAKPRACIVPDGVALLERGADCSFKVNCNFGWRDVPALADAAIVLVLIGGRVVSRLRQKDTEGQH